MLIAATLIATAIIGCIIIGEGPPPPPDVTITHYNRHGRDPKAAAQRIREVLAR